MNDSSIDVCVVGAGPAGAGVAVALGDADDASVTVFERAARIGGRAVSRRRNGCVYDYGANYIKDEGRTADLLDRLGGDLVEVEGPVYPFDADGDVAERDRPERRRFSYASGVDRFVERALDRGDATVHTDTAVTALDRSGETWLVTAGGERRRFDAVVLTPPAPETATLLAETAWSDARLSPLREAAGAVAYRPVRSVALHYPFPLEYPWYGLVNPDRDHDVGWLSREECKPGHVPEGESLLVVQLSSDWSRAHRDRSDAAVADAAADLVADFLGDPALRDPDWTDAVHWRRALPAGGAPPSVLDRGADASLFFAGDWVAGEGRVHRAFWSGHDAGERVAASAGRSPRVD